MGHKISIILSLTIIFLVFLIGVDLINILLTYTSLESVTNYVSHNISKNLTLTDSLKEYVYEQIGANLYTYETNSSFTNGYAYEYYLSKDYKVITTGTLMTIEIKRYAVINYYG